MSNGWNLVPTICEYGVASYKKKKKNYKAGNTFV